VACHRYFSCRGSEKTDSPLPTFENSGSAGHQPRSLLDGQLGGKGIRVAQTVLLFEGAAASGSRPIHGDDRNRQLLQLRLDLSRHRFAEASPRNIEHLPQLTADIKRG